MATVTLSRTRESAAPARHVDVTLLAVTGLLMISGVVLVYFATANKLRVAGYDPGYYAKRAAIYAAVGVVGLLLAVAVDYRLWKGFIPIIYTGVLSALLLVMSPLGSRSFGAKSWFSTPLFDIEPAEFAKPAMIVVIAFLLSERRGETEVRDIARVLAVLAVPTVLIFIQPDLGTALVFISVVLAQLLIAGARGRHLGVLLLIGVSVIAIVFQLGILKDYQKQRLTTFLKSDQLTTDEGPGYNVAQAKQAISAGGMFGRGPGNSTQTNLGFVPVQESDFIFTVVGEEFGFVGCVFLLTLFGVLLWRAWRIVGLARDSFGALIATGVLAMLVFQMFVNIGMTVGIMPVTGLPLPLVSLGGSTMVATCICIGLLVNVHMRRFQ